MLSLFRRSLSNNAIKSMDYPMLGRWNIQYSETVIARKIDQANEDHCGCCSPETGKEDMNQCKPIIIRNNNDEEEYYIPFTLFHH